MPAMSPSESTTGPSAPLRGRGSLIAGVAVSLAAAAVVVFATSGQAPGPLGDAFGGGGRDQAPVVEQGGVARGGVEGTEDAVSQLLARRADAVLAKDRAGFLATVDPKDAALTKAQGRWFDNLDEVPLAQWRYTLTPRTDATLPTGVTKRVALLPPDSFGAFVEVALRIAGYDNADATHDELFTFTPRAGRWYISGRFDAPGRGNRQLWDAGTVHALATDHALVLGLPPAAELRPIAAEVDRSVPRVDAVWGRGWARKVLVLVTRTEAEMADLLGGKASSYRQLAAITRGELGVADDAAAAERVVINPRAYAQLSDVGRRVIMAHEITHVAVRAVTQDWTPMWLAEGFADYIGYRGTGLSVQFIAQELVDDLRAGFAPTALPANSEFETSNSRLPQAYEMAWLACRMIVEQYGGQDVLVNFVRAAGAPAGGPASVDQAFESVLDTTRAEFTRSWRDYLQATLS